jgi:cytoskeletal protein CcmA (bactofilin family)
MQTLLNESEVRNNKTVEEPSPDSFSVDPSAHFEEWLSALELARTKLSTRTSSTPAQETPTATIYVDSIGDSDCQVSFEGVLQVEGHMAGNIRSSDGTLVMMEQGKLEADIEVGVALIRGRVKGNIRARERIVLESHARVVGNIHTPCLAVIDGAIFEGDCMFREDKVEPERFELTNDEEFREPSLVAV